MTKNKIYLSPLDIAADNSSNESEKVKIDLDIDGEIDLESDINNAYIKVSQAESIVECLLTIGDRLTFDDFNIQLVELADILHSAQANLLRSEYDNSWDVFGDNLFNDEEEIEAFEKELEKWTNMQKVKYS